MPRNSNAQKELKRRAVVFGKIAGIGTKNIARQVGCSKRYVRHLVAEPKTQFLITEACRPFRAELVKLMPKALKVIDEALSAKKAGDADHLTRLRAVERVCDMLELAQGRVQEKTGNEVSQLITWEEFVQRYYPEHASAHP